jgi:long-chain acyl-CoA synthetase
MLKPTVFPSVPRLYNKIYSKINGTFGAATGCKKFLITKAMAAKATASQRAVYTNGCWDKLVFKKVSGVLGGRVKYMITGSAPIDPAVIQFLKIAFCAPVIEGYGLTETAAGSFITDIRDPNAGHVGGPIPTIRLRLKDVPDMNYLSSDKPYPRGEVCMKGPAVFKGYYKREDKTAECFDENGWFLTGDVGMIYPNGSLKIIDRSKNIFKLSQGEYIAPEKMENIFVLSKYVEQSFVYGDSLRHCVVAIVVTSEVEAKEFAKQSGIAEDKWQEVLENADYKKLVLDDMNKLATQNNCTSLEKPKAIHLREEPFTIENEHLTPTFKLKRHQAKAANAEAIEALYNEIDAAAK